MRTTSAETRNQLPQPIAEGLLTTQTPIDESAVFCKSLMKIGKQ
jgi:hypothetical protein